VLGLHHFKGHAVLTRPVWLILTTLLTAIYYIVSVHEGLHCSDCAYTLFRCSDCKHSHQQGRSQADYCKRKVSKNLRTRLALQVYWAKLLVIGKALHDDRPVAIKTWVYVILKREVLKL